MKVFVVLLFSAVAFVAANPNGNPNVAKMILKEFKEAIFECADKHNISTEEIIKIDAAVDLKHYPASENLKCFVNCTLYKSKMVYVKTGRTNIETITYLARSRGKNVPNIAFDIYHCNSKHTHSNRLTCQEGWDLYACLPLSKSVKSVQVDSKSLFQERR